MKLGSVVASIRIAWVLLILTGAVITTFTVTMITTMKPAENRASGIELRLSSVDPPDPEPPCIIYRDIVGVPETTYLGLTVRIFNWKDTTLYFSITGSGEGYTFKTVQLGTVDSGKNKYFLLDAFATKPRPAPEELEEGEKIETIELILSAYSDEDYTDLVETYTKQVTIHWINSEDPAFNTEVLNNFDDGTVQGWNLEAVSSKTKVELSVASDYALSAPYSLKARHRYYYYSYPASTTARLYKSFTTPDKDEVFAILNIRLDRMPAEGYDSGYAKAVEIWCNNTLLMRLGGATTTNKDNVPLDRWIQVTVPLPKDQTVVIEIRWSGTHGSYGGTWDQWYILWLENFRIISKGA